MFSESDGIGPLDSLHQAGDSFAAVVRLDEEGATVLGSGVMVAPGILVTATHVLDEFEGRNPVVMTFLECGARAWLPRDWRSLSKQSAFYADRRVSSDISLLSCTLNSVAYADRPLSLAPMQIALPLIGERLWAIGFRHHAIEEKAAQVTPLISSGLVTAAYPNGRGERLPSPCIEVDMETVGGMSGGAIVNAQGRLVGILSSSIEGGPSYVTLLWEALRLRIKGTTPTLQVNETVTLLGARKINQAKLEGNVDRDPWGDTTIRLTDKENELLVSAAGIEAKATGWPEAKREAFYDEWCSELEDLGSEAAIAALSRLPITRLDEFLKSENIPDHLLHLITEFTVEDLQGVEDLTLKSTKVRDDGKVGIGFYFELLTLAWTFSVPATAYDQHAAEFDAYFYNIDKDGPEVKMEAYQRPFVLVNVVFDPSDENFSDVSVHSFGSYPRKAPSPSSGKGPLAQVRPLSPE